MEARRRVAQDNFPTSVHGQGRRSGIQWPRNLNKRSGSEEMTEAEGDSGARAWIDGAPATFEAAVAEAARLLDASAAPVIGQLGADVDGAREAVLLAERIGGALDHAASGALIADLDPIRETGAMLTTPLEAAVRADVVLVVGVVAEPDWLNRPARPHGEDVARKAIWLDVSPPPGTEASQTGKNVGLLSLLATLRARVKGRPVAASAPHVEPLASTLLQAKFGVALWSAAEIEPLAVEAIHGLVRDLNETTRFSTLSAPAADHGVGVQAVCGWMTGFPLRTGFARGRPEHDPWRYDARRLSAAGETDCIVWISAFDGAAAPPADAAIALSAYGAPGSARVSFAVARPGVDSDAIIFVDSVGAFVAKSASGATAPTVAATLAAIRAALSGPPC
jgi:formylmethanofuran dehydrogenase subunit B